MRKNELLPPVQQQKQKRKHDLKWLQAHLKNELFDAEKYTSSYSEGSADALRYALHLINKIEKGGKDE